MQARQLGELLLQRDINPDRIFCSAAVRTQQTADQVAAAARWSAAVAPVDGLYNASAAELMAPAFAQSREITQVCLVAHVPGVADLVSLLTTKHVDLAVNYGPATFAEVILDIDEWSQIGPGAGLLHLLLAP